MNKTIPGPPRSPLNFFSSIHEGLCIRDNFQLYNSRYVKFVTTHYEN